MTPLPRRALGWLVGEWQWPYAGALAAALLLAAVLPVWASALGTALALVFVQLPVYLVHQLEEHRGDAFRRYANALCGGVEALTPGATFLTNSAGVWGVDALSLYLARWVDLSLGLIAVYLTLVNALVHVLAALARREYNPGAATAVVLFLPVGGVALGEVQTAADAAAWAHGVGLGVAVGTHAAIAVHVAQRARRLRRTAQ